MTYISIRQSSLSWRAERSLTISSTARMHCQLNPRRVIFAVACHDLTYRLLDFSCASCAPCCKIHRRLSPTHRCTTFQMFYKVCLTLYAEAVYMTLIAIPDGEEAELLLCCDVNETRIFLVQLVFSRDLTAAVILISRLSHNIPSLSTRRAHMYVTRGAVLFISLLSASDPPRLLHQRHRYRRTVHCSA
jgi:hypothetical protein